MIQMFTVTAESTFTYLILANTAKGFIHDLVKCLKTCKNSKDKTERECLSDATADMIPRHKQWNFFMILYPPPHRALLSLNK